MPPAALGLILIVATTHAGWNLVLKQAQQKLVFMWWALVVGTIGFTLLLPASPPLPLRIWPYALSSALAEAGYYFALTWAYDIDDFSLIYPIARGSAPALLVLWAVLFFGEHPRAAGLLGIALLVLGLIVVGSGGIVFLQEKTRFSIKGILAAFIGWRWLGESFGAVRTVGAILIFAGILVIAIAG